MSIRTIIAAAMNGVFPNSYYRELKPDVEFPAVMWNVNSEPEPQWCLNGGYDTHELEIIFLSRNPDDFETIIPDVRAVLEALPAFQFEENSGDGEYESDPEIYAQFVTMRLRTPRY